MNQSGPAIPSVRTNGWVIYVHPMFRRQLEELSNQVKTLKQNDPVGYARKNANKRLLAIRKLMFDIVPRDPGRAEFRLGKSLGDPYKNWFRAKFFQQYRLFFRFHSKAGIIVYAWVNQEESKRAYGSKTDTYRVFRQMLENNKIPNNWDELLAESDADGIAEKAR